MRPKQNKVVMDWLNRHPLELLWTTTITLFELRYGIELLTGEHRKAKLDAAWRELANEIFAGRILSFDREAALAAAHLAAMRKQKHGRVDVQDTLIAGIAIARHATLATRNTRDFADAGIPLVDPWVAPRA
jgi:predicted nucleic acid-binding protein